MSTETQPGTEIETGSGFAPWQAGAAGGILGAIGFGLFMMFVIPDQVLEVAIPTLYGVEATPDDPALAAGWAIHLGHGAILGMGFSLLMRVDANDEFAFTNSRAGVVGLLYGIVTWGVLAMFIMPVWLYTMGMAGPGVPNVSELSLIGHALFGVLLGIGFNVLAAR